MADAATWKDFFGRAEGKSAMFGGGIGLAGSLISAVGSGMSEGKKFDYMKEKDARDEEFRKRQLAAQGIETSQGAYWNSVNNLARNAQAGADKAKMYSFTRSLLG